MTESMLKDWDNFYVIAGSSAAGLTGLTFVVIALSAESKRASLRAFNAFVTPTTVHFGTVLALASYLSIPHQTLLSLSLAFGVVGAVGVIYGLHIAAGIVGIAKDYVPVAEDWICNVILPVAAYAVLLACAFLVWHRTQACLYAVAGVSISLMFIGIHNAWDIAVWNTVRKPKDSK